MSVVIATHQRCARLDRALDEVLANVAPAEVVVVDDGSTDGTAEMLRRRAATEPRLRPVIQDNQGEMRARLAGARAARGDVVLLLDDDVVPDPGIVAGHARRHAGEAALVLVGYMPVAAGRRDRRSYPREIYARDYERHCRRWEAEPDGVLRSLWAGHLSMRRQALLDLAGDLVEDPLPYHADLDFGLRCAAAGLHGAFDRGLRSRHLYERTPAAHRGDAAKSGAGLADAHARHAAALGPLDPGFATRGLPAPAAWLVRRARSAAWPRRLLAAAVAVLGAARLLTLQRFAGRVLWRIDQQEAFARRSRELGP